MSLIPHSFLPRSMFDMDLWLRPDHLGIGPSTLDLFDPFDDLDRLMSRNLMWLNKPEFLKDLIAPVPRVPNKYRINLDVSGYNPKSIRVDAQEGGKLVVSASEGSKHDSQDYSVREFRKTYKLPDNAETDKLASFVTSNGMLVIEVPLKDAHHQTSQGDLFPRIVEASNGAKSLAMNLSLPNGIDPSKISVTCKDRDLIVKAEDKTETPDSVSSVYFYKRTTLPENTDFNSLKCNLDNNNLLSITAPVLTDFKPKQISIPIEHSNKKSL